MSAPPLAPGGWNGWPVAPPPRRPSRTLLGVLIGLLAAIIVVSAAGAALVFVRPPGGSVASPPPATTVASRPATSTPPRTPTPAVSTAQPPATATPTAADPTPTRFTLSPSPTTTAPPATAEDVLVRNPLYSRRIPPSDCSQPPRPLPTSKQADERYLKRVIGCMSDAYRAPVEAAGFKITRPDLVVYRGEVQTPCGQGLKRYPVFYCPSNQTIYSSAGSTADYGETIRLGGYWIVFHEYAHHVQRRIGVLNAAYTRDEEQLQISRRIELQADCFMAMTGISVRATRLNQRDREEMVRWREAAADQIHGRTASQLYWINRGFATDSFRRCSTWAATNHIR